jgi:hypothetical protein
MNYVEQMWQSQPQREPPGRAARIIAWVAGIAAVAAVAAFATRGYWYPYITPYF